jgi:carbon monoxide dehydrogenase subunit G
MNEPDIVASGSYTFYFDRQVVWDILMDTEAVSAALPGVKQMLPLPAERFAWQATAELDLLGKKVALSGEIRMTDIAAPTRYRLLMQSSGIQGEMQLMLEQGQEVGRTLVTWEANAAFAEPLSENMRGIIQITAMLITQQFFMGLAKQLRAIHRKIVSSSNKLL